MKNIIRTGHVGDKIWVIAMSHKPKLNEERAEEADTLDVWQWKGRTLSHYFGKPSSMDSCVNFTWLSGERTLACYEIIGENGWRNILQRARDGKELFSWNAVIGDWRGVHLQSSANGRYVGIMSNPIDQTRKCRVSLFNVETLRMEDVVDFEGFTATNAKALPSNDGRLIAVFDGPHPRIVDVAKRTFVLVAAEEDTTYLSHEAVFSPDGKTLYIGRPGLEILAVKSQTGEIQSRWHATSDGQYRQPWMFAVVADMDVSSDGEYLAVATVDFGDVYLRSLKTDRVIRLLHGKGEEIRLMSFSPDGESLVTFAAGTFKIWSGRIPETK